METPELLFKPMPTESLSSAQLRLQEHPAMTKPKEPYETRCIDCGRAFYLVHGRGRIALRRRTALPGTPNRVQPAGEAQAAPATQP